MEPSFDDLREGVAELLASVLEGARDDVQSLLRHLGSSLREAEKACEGIGDEQSMALAFGDPNRPQRSKQLMVLATAYRVARKMEEHLLSGEPVEAVCVGTLMCESLIKRAVGNILGIQLARKTANATFAANSRHSRPGASMDKRSSIRAAWASGKFSSRTRCAEEECAGLGMSYDAARKALRNTPDPA